MEFKLKITKESVHSEILSKTKNDFKLKLFIKMSIKVILINVLNVFLYQKVNTGIFCSEVFLASKNK